MSGQAVQREGVRRRLVEQRVVEPVGRERLPRGPRVRAVVAHRDPHVRVDGVRSPHRLVRVLDQRRARAVVEAVARRRGDHDLHLGEPAEHGQRPCDVVAVADVGEPAAGDRPERLAQRHQVGQRLARVVQRREHVHHRHRGVLGQLVDHPLLAGAHADRRRVAGEDQRRVAQRLPARELQLARAQDHRMPPELHHGGLERRARARRGLLEQQGDGAALQRPRGGGRLLERERPVEQRGQLRGLQLQAGEEVARQARECTFVAVRVLTWNLFHGRSRPSAGRSLLNEFAAALDGWEWDVALLQEVPPWWPPWLAEAAGARAFTALTSRNWLLGLRRAMSSRNPDILKSNGGGANAILVRGEAGDHRVQELTRLPERRVAHGVRLAGGAWVVNVHATTQPLSKSKPRTWADCRLAAAAAAEWAAGAPLVFGGDLNLKGRPELPGLRHVAGNHVDHILVDGFEPVGRGEVLERGRLSDHPPVAVTLRLSRAGRSPAA
jgi:endonuclease/exonuclease/phosphatase family metal-dependent hydrolase